MEECGRRIEVKIDAEGLRGIEESQCVVLEMGEGEDGYREVERTESVLDPRQKRWEKVMHVDFFFDRIQNLRFLVHDIFTNPIFHIDTTFAALLTDKPYTLSTPCNTKHLLITTSIPPSECFSFQFKAEKVDKKDLFGKSDPYFILYKMSQPQGWVALYKSETIKNTLDPTWAEFHLKAEILGNMTCDVALKLEFWDWDRNKNDDFIGVVNLNLSQLFIPSGQHAILNPSKQSQKKYKNSGIFHIQKSSIERKFSFIDYFHSRNQIKLAFAIDFTQLNGNSSFKSSMHYSEPDRKNKYEEMIENFGSVLEIYNKDKSFFVFGFGAESFDGHTVNDFFMLSNQSITSTQAVIQVYKSVVPLISQSKSAKLQSLISFIISLVTGADSSKSYLVGLVLLCGPVEEISSLKPLLCSLSTLPISLIFIEMGKFMCNDPSDFIPSDQTLRKNILFFRLKDHHNDIPNICKIILNSIPTQIESLI